MEGEPLEPAGVSMRFPLPLRGPAALGVVILPILLSLAGCSPEEKVVGAWEAYRVALADENLIALANTLTPEAAAELDSEDAATKVTMVAAMTPATVTLGEIEVGERQARIHLTASFDGQPMSGEVELALVGGEWKVAHESWSIEMGGSMSAGPVTGDLAARLQQGPSSFPQPSMRLSGHEDEVTKIAFTPDGSGLVSVSYGDHKICYWSAFDGTLQSEAECDHRPQDMVLTPDGKAAIVVDAYGNVTRWPLEWGTLGAPYRLEGGTGRGNQIAISADGKTVATTSFDDDVMLWDLETGKSGRKFEKSIAMRGVAFSPLGPVLATGHHGNTFTVWDLESKIPFRARRNFKIPKVGEQSDVWSVAFSPDGEKVATGHMDSSVTIWNVKKGKQIYNGYVMDASTYDVVFSPDGTTLTTAHADGRVYFWDPSSGRRYGWLDAHEGAAKAIAFHPSNSEMLATGGEDGVIVLWM